MMDRLNDRIILRLVGDYIKALVGRFNDRATWLTISEMILR